MSRSATRRKIKATTPANDAAVMPLVLQQTRAWLGGRTAGQGMILAFLLFAVGLSLGISAISVLQIEGRQQGNGLSAAPVSGHVPDKSSIQIAVTDRQNTAPAADEGGIALPASPPMEPSLQKALLDTASRAVGTMPLPAYPEKVQVPDDDNDIRNLRRAIRLNPRNVKAQLALVAAFQEAGDWDGAEEVLLDALDREPKNPHYHLQLARLYDAMRRYRDALAEYRWVLNSPRAGQENFPFEEITARAEFLVGKMGGR